MNLKKRMNYGSRGYYLPPIPHIPNQAKGKRTNRRKLVDNNPFGAFDLLATIAGKLLTGLENEPINNSGAPNCTQSKLDIVKKEPKTESSTNDSGIIVSNLNPTKTLIGESGTKQENDDINNNVNNVDNDNNDGLVRSNSSNSSSEMPLYSGVNPNPNPNLFLEKRVYRDDNDENSTNKFKMNNNLSAQKPFIAKLRKAASYNKTNDESNTKCYARKRTQKRKSEFCSDGDLYNKEVKKRSLSSSQKQQERANHVKLSIKSFKVPELLIEIPESATIATLKKVVMETVTAVLEGEIRVGVMVQSKAVRDDTRTLKQVGIYQNATGVIDTLNFSLEPEHSAPHVSSQTQEEGEHIIQPLASIAPNTLQTPSQFETTNNMGTVPVSVPVPTTPVKSHVSDPDPTSPMEVTSQAIVPVVPVKEELMEPVPAEPVRKWRHSEMMMLGQRRIRRPFSVGEVEALVSAVELLGTGRWRDVKIRAFDDAKHRTYVDLKDKWKTLVHTASIAPQQRRGEPVPQDLLDRVLLAQAHWAHQHSKMHARSSPFNADPGLAIFDSSPVALESN